MKRRNHEKMIDVKIKVNKRLLEDTLIRIMLFIMALISVMAFILMLGCSMAMVENWTINNTSLIVSIISLVWLGFYARFMYKLYY